MQNNKGQALTELALMAPVLILFVIAVIWFARVLLTWQQLVSASRYGTDMITNTTLSAQEIKQDIKNYLTHHWIEGRKLDKNQIKEIKVDIKDYPKLSLSITDLPSSLTNIDEIIKGFVLPSKDLSNISIIYEYDVPKLISLTTGKKLDLIIRSVVLSGTGCQSNLHNRRD
ncbi:MAG: pilus assembly protein [Endomicrobiaceae bacterium]|nr:pilus assembly protein [Endomicrobiaceae bacterium]